MSLPAGSSGVPDRHARRPGTVPRLEGVEGDIRSPPGRGRVLLMVDITALEDVTDEANAIIDEIPNIEDQKAIVVYNPE